MKVKDLIEWLSKQNPELDVEVGMHQEYQNGLDLDCCQVVHDYGSYVLLGELAPSRLGVTLQGITLHNGRLLRNSLT